MCPRSGREFELALMRVELARKREPMQACMMFLLNTVHPSQKKNVPRHLQLARSEEESIWKVSVSPILMRSARPTLGMTEMLAEKLKWIGRDTNL